MKWYINENSQNKRIFLHNFFHILIILQPSHNIFLKKYQLEAASYKWKQTQAQCFVQPPC